MCVLTNPFRIIIMLSQSVVQKVIYSMLQVPWCWPGVHLRCGCNEVGICWWWANKTPSVCLVLLQLRRCWVFVKALSSYWLAPWQMTHVATFTQRLLRAFANVRHSAVLLLPACPPALFLAVCNRLFFPWEDNFLWMPLTRGWYRCLPNRVSAFVGLRASSWGNSWGWVALECCRVTGR